jgi:hypothetical protein
MFSKEKLKKELDNYLEFDSSLLFENTDYLVIYGGSLRDIISKNTINDIDIMCLPHSMETAIKALTDNGYFYIDLYTKDVLNMYDDLHVIFEPKTYINSKGKKVQFIRPSVNSTLSRNRPRVFTDLDVLVYSFIELLKNIDLSCCGLFWDGEELFESYIGSVKQCEERKFVELPRNTMYNRHRIDDRKRKMIYEKFFDEILENTLSDIRRERLHKLNEICTEEKSIDDYLKKISFDKKTGTNISDSYEEDSKIDFDDLPF